MDEETENFTFEHEAGPEEIKSEGPASCSQTSKDFELEEVPQVRSLGDVLQAQSLRTFMNMKQAPQIRHILEIGRT